MSIYTKMTHQYLLHNKRSTLYTLIGIILSVALLTSIGTYIISAQAQSLDIALKQSGRYHIQVEQANADIVQKIKANLNVKQVGLLGYEQLTTPRGQKLGLVNMDETARLLLPFRMVRQVGEEQEGLIVERWVAAQLSKQIEADNRIVLTNQNGSKMSFAIHQIVANRSSQSESEYRQLMVFRLVPQVTETTVGMLIEVKEQGDLNAVLRQLEELVPSDRIKTNHSLITQLQRNWGGKSYISSDYAVIYIIPSFLVLLAAIAFIYNIFQISVAKRIKHFGLLRAIGATRKHVRNMVMYEAFLLGLIGIPLGLFFGVGAVWLVAFIFKLFYEGGDYSLLHIRVIISPLILLLSTVISGCAIYVSVWLPVRSAGRILPLAGIRKFNSYNRRRRWFAGLKRQLSRLISIENILVYRSIKRSKRRFWATIFSLALSVSLFGTFTIIARLIDYESPINRKADITIYNDDNRNSNMANLVNDLRDIDEIQAYNLNYTKSSIQVILPSPIVAKGNDITRGDEVEVDQKKHYAIHGGVSLFDERNIPWLQRELIEGDMDALKNGSTDGVIIVGQIKFGGSIIHTGDELFLRRTEYPMNNSSLTSSELLKVKVLAVIRGEVTYPEIIVPRPLYDQLSADESLGNEDMLMDMRSIELILTNKAHLPHVMQLLEDRVEKDPNISVVNNLQEKRERAIVTLQTLVMIYGFVTVIVLISCLNMLNTLMMNILVRRHELALLQSIGMAHKGVRAMIIREGVLYGIISGLMGAALTYQLITITPSDLGGTGRWILWSTLIEALVGATLVGYMAAHIALRSLKTNNLMDLLKGES
ncbi:FtsX-like permease family protein [Paenibacillus albiflavus]|uniref:FtsX-like permease family protein n=1 Tax=Paenibacillus albiflavus TaxID=2545760 RepID=A0A4R4EGL2_9BACL|nr:ABC transporter permease [Paenibacillus albiflavus]TCZ78747.1 FtsX-like permease family protein [Paenibacillus albiflavus]